jgi:hypothetical protein
VTLPPGLLKLATMPVWTGLAPVVKTMGIVVVAALATGTATAPPPVKITATGRRTSSAASAGIPGLYKAHFAQSFAECRLDARVGRTNSEISNGWNGRLLRPRRHRPRRRASEPKQ